MCHSFSSTSSLVSRKIFLERSGSRDPFLGLGLAFLRPKDISTELSSSSSLPEELKCGSADGERALRFLLFARPEGVFESARPEERRDLDEEWPSGRRKPLEVLEEGALREVVVVPPRDVPLRAFCALALEPCALPIGPVCAGFLTGFDTVTLRISGLGGGLLPLNMVKNKAGLVDVAREQSEAKVR
jgi:hypothetical protein